MSICTLPPKGWKCSREAGHDGPCAASQILPYEEYADKVVSGLVFAAQVHKVGDEIRIEEFDRRITDTELKNLIKNAWMDGLKYSLVMIESEKRNRDTKET